MASFRFDFVRHLVKQTETLRIPHNTNPASAPTQLPCSMLCNPTGNRPISASGNENPTTARIALNPVERFRSTQNTPSTAARQTNCQPVPDSRD